MTNGSERIPDYEPCGLGICAANAGHEGTCAEASGWDGDWAKIGYRTSSGHESTAYVELNSTGRGEGTDKHTDEPVTVQWDAESSRYVEVSADEHRIKHGTIICLGDRSSPCHNYPACECEYWDSDPITGKHQHPDEPHDDCWLLPWLQSPQDTATDDTLDRIDAETGKFPDGHIGWEWEGEYAIWYYLDDPEPATTDAG